MPPLKQIGTMVVITFATLAVVSRVKMLRDLAGY